MPISYTKSVYLYYKSRYGSAPDPFQGGTAQEIEKLKQSDFM